jgi:hypothetical protein
MERRRQKVKGARAPSARSNAAAGKGFRRICRAVIALSLVSIAASLAFSGPALALATSHGFKTTFAGSGTSALSNPTDVAVDNSTGPSAHDVYVTDPAHYRIEKFTPSGEFLLMFGKNVDQTTGGNVCPEHLGDTCKVGSEGSSPGAFTAPAFVAVDSSPSGEGDVYVGDTGDGSVSKFDSFGDLVASWGASGQLAGLGSIQGIAVDPTGNLFVETGDISWYEQSGAHHSDFGYPRGTSPSGLAVDAEDNLYKIDGSPNVTKFSDTGTDLSDTLDGGSASGLTIDPSTNDLFVDESGSFINHFALNCGEGCAPIETFGGGNLAGAEGLSIDGTSDTVYAANTGAGNVAVFEYIAPTVTTGAPSNVTETSATLNGHVDPGTHGEVIECEFEYGFSNSYSLGIVPCAQGSHLSSPTDVTATLSGLQPKTKYHYRLVASNENGGVGDGRDETLLTTGPPVVDTFFSSHLGATTATLNAKITPDGVDTKYVFEYGTTTAYGETAPSPPGEITKELFTSQPVEVHLNGLQEGVTYHFRVVATNENGTITTEDQSFNFSPPVCPNEHVRQQTGAGYLPDCRAYELVSPSSEGNLTPFPAAAPASEEATEPSRLAYAGAFGIIPGVGEPSNVVGDMYVATRTTEGWVSRFVGLPSSETFMMGGPPADASNEIYGPALWQDGVVANPSLSKILDWNDGYPNGGYNGQCPCVGSSNAGYVWDSTSGNLLGRFPTNLVAVPNGEEFSGQPYTSRDLTHYVFTSNLAFAEEGVPGDTYDNNTITETTADVSRATGGADKQGGTVKISSDGSHILMSANGELYMRINDTVTAEIAPGHGVNYVGMPADGSKVYFTSNEQLTPDDKDTSTDLYMWSEKGEESGEPVILVSKGDNEGNAGQPGNTDSCNASWTSQCNVEPISFSSYGQLIGGLGGNCHYAPTCQPSDSFLASGNGDIYFYSPEQLDGAKGTINQQNLYVFRGGHVQYVTTFSPGSELCTSQNFGDFCSNGPVVRMDVAPDDSHIAFITASQVTSYENAKHAEMYSYEPSTGKLNCDSCIPDGAPPTGELFGSQNGLFMTNDGRTFFSTTDALVPQDTNQNVDVYEYTEGRPQLITSGTSPGTEIFGFVGAQTYPGLVGVSANGTDVYFSTFEVLVGQDENGNNLKLYDARTDGGFPFVPPPPECAAADECHGSGSSPPLTPADGTGADLGSGGNGSPLPRRVKHHQIKKRHRRRHASRRHHRRHTARGTAVIQGWMR